MPVWLAVGCQSSLKSAIGRVRVDVHAVASKVLRLGRPNAIEPTQDLACGDQLGQLRAPESEHHGGLPTESTETIHARTSIDYF